MAWRGGSAQRNERLRGRAFGAFKFWLRVGYGDIITDSSSREPFCWSFALGFFAVIPVNELMLNRLYHIFGGFFSSTSMSTIASWSRERGRLLYFASRLYFG